MKVLYQFRISHYCEKARWALDYANIPYRTRNLLVGPHLKQIKKIAPDSSVPVLKIEDRYIQGSDKILDYVDTTAKDAGLTPADSSLAQQARQWESFADRYLGEPVRCLLYHDVLEKPHILLPLWLDQGPFYGRLFYLLAYQKLKAVIRVRMHVNEKTAALSMRGIERGIKRLDAALTESDYLAGPSFSRADLAVCSLLAPLLCPEQSGYRWHDDMSPALTEFRQSLLTSATGRWVLTTYEKHRRC